MLIIKSMKLVALLLLAALPLTACSSAVVARETAPVTTTAAAGAHRHAAYVVGGRVKGLEGIGLAVSNSRGQELQVEDDGRFVFRTTLEDGADFSITIERQPISPAQTCVVERASGKITGKNALETTIVCSTVSFEAAPASDAVAAR